MAEGRKAMTAEGAGSTTGNKNSGRGGGIDWSDPNVPVGNAPLLARWPLILAGLAWVAGIVFLAAMAVSRLRTNAL